MKAALFALFGLLVWSLSMAANYVGILQIPAVPLLVVTVTGGGTVTSSPAGISCTSAGGAGCSAAWANSTSVTLTATGVSSNATATTYGTGTKNSAWGGIACTGQAVSGTCSLTFNGATTATTTFSPYDTDVYYVAASGGSDANNCRFLVSTGSDGPCATAHHVNGLMTAGDTLYYGPGTYNTVANSIGFFNGQFGVSDLPDGTSQKSTRYLSSTVYGAIIDGKYQFAPVYLFQRHNIEVGGFVVQHGIANGGILSADGSTNGTGANLTPVLAGGQITSVGVTAGGTSYTTTASNRVTIYGITCTTYPQYTYASNGGGTVTSTSQVNAGAGCTENVAGSLGASVDMKSANIYFHDNISSQFVASSHGVGVYCNRCANSLFLRNVSYGYGARYGINFFAGVWNVARQNIARFDGFVGADPMAGVAIYTEDYTIAENNIVLDFNKAPNTDDGSAFYATASSLLPAYPYGLGTVQFLGNIAINVNGPNGNPSFRWDNNQSMASTPAGGVTPYASYQNNVAAVNSNSANGADMVQISDNSLAATHGAYHNFVLDAFTLYDKAQNPDTFGSMIRFYNNANSITLTGTSFNSPDYPTIACLRSAVAVTPANTNNWFNCNNTTFTAVPGTTNVNPLQTWLLRPGSAAVTSGATVNFQYVNGALGVLPLWPWINQDAIKTYLCAGPDDAATPTVGGNALTVGNTYYITTVGNTNWVSAGAASSTLGIRFTAINTGNGSTGTATPNINTRGHNLTGFCASALTLTNYIWSYPLGTLSPY